MNPEVLNANNWNIKISLPNVAEIHVLVSWNLLFSRGQHLFCLSLANHFQDRWHVTSWLEIELLFHPNGGCVHLNIDHVEIMKKQVVTSKNKLPQWSDPKPISKEAWDNAKQHKSGKYGVNHHLGLNLAKGLSYIISGNSGYPEKYASDLRDPVIERLKNRGFIGDNSQVYCKIGAYFDAGVGVIMNQSAGIYFGLNTREFGAWAESGVSWGVFIELSAGMIIGLYWGDSFFGDHDILTFTVTDGAFSGGVRLYQDPGSSSVSGFELVLGKGPSFGIAVGAVETIPLRKPGVQLVK
ncbi:type I phosphoribosyltransferase [Flavilitoribacter nigricans]|uniref:Uncharacterized protein n=1 Tax=Flavilitoribacter nigricans (strain ATCC 23147 / DSM 23189 / NBRC 102662 / NCIMB 1420 / SS-2) TaxID=1122177 RepID=A0A2D0MWU7_FLAN2|nr:hypothetical protein [Flavilitoribacter nigricans]PHN00751.1 hypothetical protein CRP01_40540 [Flavilitoribacter nigricans DSM 23189 = NBRC 102662]